MEDVRDLELLLESRGDYYKHVLRRLDGCAEMGIRVMVHDRPAAHAADSPTGESLSPECSNPGMLYLLRRKDRYSAESLRAEQQERISEEFRTEFAGMFKEFTSEASKPTIQGSDAGAFLVSLYFLVPKDLVTAFRHQFDSPARKTPSKLLLSGPWPPYNFVLPGEPQFK